MDALLAKAADLFLDYAQGCAPLEACGFVINDRGRVRVRSVENLHREPGQFEMRADDVALMLSSGVAIAIIHSHVGEDAQPSEMDMQLCMALDMPSVIVSVDDGSHTITYPPGWEPPLTGRPWVYGVSDCYSLLRDGMRRYQGIALPDFERAPWDSDAWDMLADHFMAAGFLQVDDAWQPGDVALFRFLRGRADHCGVILEGNRLLHHAEGRMSAVELFSDFWRSHVVMHLRHREARP